MADNDNMCSVCGGLMSRDWITEDDGFGGPMKAYRGDPYCLTCRDGGLAKLDEIVEKLKKFIGRSVVVVLEKHGYDWEQRWLSFKSRSVTSEREGVLKSVGEHLKNIDLELIGIVPRERCTGAMLETERICAVRCEGETIEINTL